MIKKVIKHILRILLILTAILILLPFTLYIPGVQDFVRKQAESIVSESTGMELSVGRIRIGFPLRVAIDDATLLTPVRDTMVSFEAFRIDVAFWPLLRKNVAVRHLGIEKAVFNLGDSTSSLILRTHLGNLSLDGTTISLGQASAEVRSLKLEGGTVRLCLGEPQPDTTATDTTAGVKWAIIARQLDFSDIDFAMTMPPSQPMSLSAMLPAGRISDAAFDMKTNSVTVGTLSLDRGSYSFVTGSATPTATAPFSAGTPQEGIPVGVADTSALTVPADSTGSQSAPWNINVGHISITDNTLAYKSLKAPEETGPEAGQPSRSNAMSARRTNETKISDDRGNGSVHKNGTQKNAARNDSKSSKPDIGSTTGNSNTSQAGNINGTNRTAGKSGSKKHSPHTTGGIDPDDILITRFNLSADSIHNRGSQTGITIGNISFEERSGLTVKNISGRFDMDSVRISLDKFYLATAHSSLSASLKADASILKMDHDASVSSNLTADISLPEIASLLPAGNSAIDAAVRDKHLKIASTANGTLGHFSTRNSVSVPRHMLLTVSGTATSVTTDGRSGSFRLGGDLSDLSFLKGMLDTATAERIGIPPHIMLDGQAQFNRQKYAADLTVKADTGTIDLKGRIDIDRQDYDATLAIRDFPLQLFLPADSLGIASLSLSAAGHGFDPMDTTARADIALRIGEFDFRGYRYHDIGLNAELNEGALRGSLTSDNSALRLNLTLGGRISRSGQEMAVRGMIDMCDLHRMNLSPQEIALRLFLDASASVRPADRAVGVDLAIDSLAIIDNGGINRIKPITLSAATSLSSTEARLRSGDLTLSFSSPDGLDTMLNDITRMSEIITAQLETGSFNMEELSPSIPSFRFGIDARRENILSNFLKLRKIYLTSLSVDISHAKGSPLKASVDIYRPMAGGLLLDSLRIALFEQGQQLGYSLRLRNTPDNDDDISLVSLSGGIVHNDLRLNVLQQNNAGQDGIRFGLLATRADSTISLSMYPEHPLLGFEEWTLNPGNHISYLPDGAIGADLRLSRNNNLFAVQASANDSINSVSLDIAGIDIGKTLSMFLQAPPVQGILNAKIHAGLDLKNGFKPLDADADISIGALSYGGNPVGDIDMTLGYKPVGGRIQTFASRVTFDKTEILNAKGSYSDTAAVNRIDLGIDMAVPLRIADAFLPQDIMSLSGTLNGSMTFAGTTKAPKLNGYMQFTDTKADIKMIGTSFGISGNRITVKDNLVRFDDYRITGPNRQPITIGGTVDLADFSSITTDLAVKASNFQMVNVRRGSKTMVYGQAYMDMNTTVRGPLDNLAVNGSVDLLGTTDLTYVMQDSPLEVENKQQNMVTFVSFSDTTAVYEPDTLRNFKLGGMNLLINVNVDNNVQMGVDLSADGKNHIKLRGGGNLTYTMNQLGDTRLSGRYEVNGGTVSYSPPVISQKVFAIDQGSYVNWTGNIADPSFNITAVETVRTNVTTDDSPNGRPVKFNIIINIRNTLENLSVTFDLSAPEDLTMQNQLSSLTAEQRATQAMSLLIYNTYSGPGTSAKVNSGNPLDAFIAKELNQWAQNNIKGVDLSFGIDSYDETGSGGTQRTDYSYKISKSLFNNRVKAVIGGKFSTDADPSENLEQNLIDDISLEYMLTKRDNMFLKVFRHTDYESILEGEVTATGAGFVVRKQMARLGDLFRLSKSKQERRQERKEAKAAKAQARSLKKQRSQPADNDGSTGTNLPQENNAGNRQPSDGTLPDGNDKGKNANSSSSNNAGSEPRKASGERTGATGSIPPAGTATKNNATDNSTAMQTGRTGHYDKTKQATNSR